MKEDVCMDHSGCIAKIEQCQKNDADIFIRLGALEKAVWKAAGASGAITTLAVLIIEGLMRR